MAKILVIGKTGQVAQALSDLEPLGLKDDVIYVSRQELDLASPDAAYAFVFSAKPELVINAAAYTAVDRAESEPELATRVNSATPGALAKACAEIGAALIHYSTDYVFPGTGTQSWTETDETSPLSQYGKSKLQGERAILSTLPRSIILRTSWVFYHSGSNFVRTMLRLGSEREVLKVVSDQFGAPTSAVEIARATWKIAERILGGGFADWGIYHLAARGQASWNEFAKEIFTQASGLGLPLKVQTVDEIETVNYPTPARRPLNSRLNCDKLERTFGIRLPDWCVSLNETLQTIADRELKK